jgi:hypothetical protein
MDDAAGESRAEGSDTDRTEGEHRTDERNRRRRYPAAGR